MGKHSRRKGKITKGVADDKKAHKERQQERRRRNIEALDFKDEDDDLFADVPSDDDDGEATKDDIIDVGDRVRYALSVDQAEWKWGVVKARINVGETGEDPMNKVYSVLPWEAAEDKHALVRVRHYESVYVNKERHKVDVRMTEKTRGIWTLRFSVGDRVFCRAYSDSKRKGDFDKGAWRSATVECLRPRWYDVEKLFATEACYRCTDDKTGDFLFAMQDTDEYIVAFDETKLRFSKGEKVVCKMKGRWVNGTVVNTIIGGKEDLCTEYSLRLDDGDRAFRLISPDTDEWIARVDTGPRQRLFHAIDQNCSYDHLNHLVTTSGLEVSSFGDLILSRAIQACGYYALGWIQDTMQVDLNVIRDADGNGLLHQISTSSRAARFFETANSITDRDRGYISMYAVSGTGVDGLFFQVDRRGRSWLHRLVIAGNLRALDIALTTVGQFSRDLARAFSLYAGRNPSSKEAIPAICVVTRDEKGTNIRDAARVLGRHDMVKIIDLCAKWQTVRQLVDHLDGSPDLDYIKANVLPKFGEMPTSCILRKVQHFLSSARCDSSFSLRSLHEFAYELGSCGNLPMFSWLIEGAPALLDVSTRRSHRTTANVNEFAQPELFDSSLEKGAREPMGLVSIVAHGEGQYFDFTPNNRKSYGSMLSSIVLKRTDDLIVYIKNRLEQKYLNESSLLEYKHHLLCDDEFLSKRLELLDYLVKEKAQPPPAVLDIIRWRQCGVLRWMVRESFVDLTRSAVDDLSTAGVVEKVQFLGVGGWPLSATVGTFLCFAAVEYDDLQSMEWLITEHDISVTTTRCNGWNLLHACSYFGRTEIADWIIRHVTRLNGRAAAQQLVSEPCDREGSRNLYAVNIAVQRGYIQLAEFLLSSGCPQQDKKGTSIYSYAKQSQFGFVREWSTRNEQSMKAKSKLEKEIKHLHGLLASPGDSDRIAKAMDLIRKSRCLDIQRWDDVEFDHVDVPGPLGRSYRDVIDDCCKMGGTDFVVWLCAELSPPAQPIWSLKALIDRFNIFWGNNYNYSWSKTGLLDHAALTSFAMNRNDSLHVAACLGMGWTRKITCHDPSQMHPLMKQIMKQHGENASVTAGLTKLRDSMVHDELLFRVLDLASGEVRRLFACTAPLETITRVLQSMQEIAKDVDESLLPDLDRWMFSAYAKVDVNCYLPCDYGSEHVLRNHSLFSRKPGSYLCALFIVLAVEGCEELIRWSMKSGRSNWDAEKELIAVRIAAYLGHAHIVDMFLQVNGELSMSSTLPERKEAALLGALEGGFVDEIENRGLLPTSSSKALCDFSIVEIVNAETTRDMLASSIVAVAVFAYLCKGNDRGPEALKWVKSNTDIELVAFVRAVVLIQKSYSKYGKFVDLYTQLINDLGLNPFSSQNETSMITDNILSEYYCDGHGTDESILQQWLTLLMNLGLDIQSIVDKKHVLYERHKSLSQMVNQLQAEQLRAWSKFDIVRKGGSLETIQQAVVSGDMDLTCYNSNGLKLVHVVAAFDRVDVLEWLVDTDPLQLYELDGSGRSVLKVAIASNATNASLWISRRKAEQRIALFVVSSIRRRHAVEEIKSRLRLFTAIQAWCRGFRVRRAYRGHLYSQLQQTQKFYTTWGHVLSMVEKDGMLDGETSWSAIKTNRFDLLGSMNENLEDAFSPEDHDETSKKVASATSMAASAQHDESVPNATHDNDEIDHSNGTEPSVAGVSSELVAGFDRILLTRAVLRWRRQADPKYLDIFVTRIKQLAAGDRSILLKKSLTGCKTIIYEAKLDAGQRILWTEEASQGLIVWYVAKHDEVSRLVRLMDKAESRSNRQLTSASTMPEIEEQLLASGDTQTISNEAVILDPQGDTPLRLFNIHREDIYKLGESSRWQPPLHLTTTERQVVETQGTVLLLGRSGTGKTICICNRIDSDRDRAEGAASFKQLFVARSKRICTMVEDLVGKDRSRSSASAVFVTFTRLLLDCGMELPGTVSGGPHTAFLPSMKMDFARFKTEVCHKGSPLDPLLLWTQIRSLIKGSITNLARPRTRDEYMGLGKNECRLTQEQRSACYSVFETYARHMIECKLWDDCDRITYILRQLQSDPEARFAMAYNKVYVDEIQDYTQIEVALFFLLCRHHSNLFFAGDPAQSVVEGSDFRFEDIRTAAHHLFQNEKSSGKKGMIPDKPLKLNVNFRSHSGILNVASGVLDMLFSAFPGSAKELPKDKGLFLGPRPGIFMNVEPLKLQELLSKIDGAFVLTHDAEMSKIKRCLGNYELILGIRESKGLEFKDVVLIDFFKGLSAEHQKPWRNLLQGRNEVDLKPGFPEIESHLKLLYTAVTRASGRLFIAETGSSIAGQALYDGLQVERKNSAATMMHWP